MTRFSSQNTSLRQKRVIAPRTLSEKTAVLIVCNFVPAPVLIMIHSLFSRLKYRGREAFL